MAESAPTSWTEKFDSIEYKNRRSAQLICDPKSIPIFSIISLHRDPKNIQIFFYKLIYIIYR